MRPRHVHAAARQSVQDLVEERLHLLEPAAGAIVTCAALLGYRIDAKVLALCAGAGIEATLEALRRACDFDLVITEAEEPNRYRFRHALTQAAIRDAVVAGTKRELHAGIARVLERLPDAVDRVEQISYHWSAAGNGAPASASNRQAAEHALCLGSARIAAEFSQSVPLDAVDMEVEAID